MTVRVAEIGLAGAAGIAETGDSTAASGPQAESSGGIVRGNRPAESSAESSAESPGGSGLFVGIAPGKLSSGVAEGTGPAARWG